jgi:mechanosensitive ion channel-like protein
MNYFDPVYSTSVVDSLRTLYERIILYLPNVIIALIVLILGWIIGSFLGSLVARVLSLLHVDDAANTLGLQRLSGKTGRPLSIARLGHWIVKWFFFLASFIAAADILGLTQVTQFFYNEVLAYAGHVVVAMAILLLGLLAANFFSGLIESAVRASGIAKAGALAALARWAILAFTVIAMLSELQIATNFLQDLFRAIVAMVAIAGGLAFGLGGRDHAKKILDSVENSLNNRV